MTNPEVENVYELTEPYITPSVYREHVLIIEGSPDTSSVYRQHVSITEGPPDTSASSSLGEDVDEHLRCPVCLGMFKDPCFVCPGHHNLCRRCYERLLEASIYEEPRCPECRQPLTNRPIENTHLQKLIQAAHLMPPRGATCKWEDEAGECSIPVFVKCKHCDTQLCSRHFSIHLVRFEEDCQKLLDQVQQDIKKADPVRVSLESWNSRITDLIEFLNMEKERLQDLLNSTKARAQLATSISNRRLEAAALQAALRSDNLQAARASFDQLCHEPEAAANSGLDNVGPPPTDEQKTEIEAAKNAIDILVGTMTGTCGGVHDDLIEVYDGSGIYSAYDYAV